MQTSLIKYFMEYNDFQILSNDTYKLMNEQFNNSQPFTKRACVNKLQLLIAEFRALTASIQAKTNHKIRNELEKVSSNISKLENNLQAIFNTKRPKATTIKSFNIFNTIQTIIKILLELQNWSKNETKEYHLNFIEKTTNEFLLNLDDLFLVMSKLNIILFKHM